MEKTNNKKLGGILGFLVGDALGLPISGLKKEEILLTVGSINSYITNFRHPYFYFLKIGQYGSNSMQMIATLENIIGNNDLSVTLLDNSLYQMALRSKKDFFFSRWFGQTTLKALLTRKPSNSYSATCVYRTIPIALLYNNLEEALEDADKQTTITHLSSSSRAVSHFVCHLLFHLKSNEANFINISKNALESTKQKYPDATRLIRNLELVINNKIENLTQARKVLGTSSLTYEIIPLALYIFLKFATSFEEAVLAGANSFRNDSEEEKQKLAHYSYLEELVEARGGCTDGIAGLVGSFCGTYLGLSSIPEKLLQPLENREKITKLIKTTF